MILLEGKMNKHLSSTAELNLTDLLSADTPVESVLCYFFIQGGIPPAPTGAAQCTSNQFYCSADDLCININWKCDGEQDCTDGEDELKCPPPSPQPTPPPGSSHPADCNFDKDYCLWESAKFADMRWLRNQGQTPSWNTGPSADKSGAGNKIHTTYVTWLSQVQIHNCCCFL